MALKITGIWCDFVEAHHDYAQNLSCFIIGKGTVEKILEHTPEFSGDKWYYDIYFAGGKVQRTFNPYKVFYTESEVDNG